jgi:hypothetical protein
MIPRASPETAAYASRRAAKYRRTAGGGGGGVCSVGRGCARARDHRSGFRRQLDACADAAATLAAEHAPGDALALWLQRYADFIATKRGLAPALHSGDPAFNALPA